MTNRTAAAKLAVCKWIRDQVGKWEDEAKAELSDMVAGDRQAALLAGYKIGTVTMCEGKRGVRVIDENRLGEWVAARWPEQIQTVVQIHPAFMRALADRTLKHGALIDDDGEVCPWVELRHGEPYLMTKADPDMDGVMQTMLAQGFSIDSIIRELPEGTTDASHAVLGTAVDGTARDPWDGRVGGSHHADRAGRAHLLGRSK